MADQSKICGLFNDERLAYAIVGSEAPIISGVGHETDFTIADFVSDLRAPTPTAAAELATPNRLELKAELSDEIGLLNRSIQTVTAARNWQVERLQNRLIQLSPLMLVHSSRQRIDDLTFQINRSMAHLIRIGSTELAGSQGKLTSLNPLSVLKRGYAIVTQLNGTLVHSIAQVQAGNNLEILLQDGKFPVTVQNSPAAE